MYKFSDRVSDPEYFGSGIFSDIQAKEAIKILTDIGFSNPKLWQCETNFMIDNDDPEEVHALLTNAGFEMYENLNTGDAYYSNDDTVIQIDLEGNFSPMVLICPAAAYNE